MHFGATLRLLRMDAGLSLRDLARRIGVSSAYLSRVEHGLDAVPTPERLTAIAQGLDVPPTLLMDVAHRVNPVVSSYLEQEPAARALVLEVAQRELTAAQLGRVRAFIEREFPLRRALKDTQPMPLGPLLSPERIIVGLSCAGLEDALDVVAGRLGGLSPEVGATALAAMLRQREEENPSAVGRSWVDTVATASSGQASGASRGSPGASWSRVNHSTEDPSIRRAASASVTSGSTVPRSSPITSAPARSASRASTASITSAS